MRARKGITTIVGALTLVALIWPPPGAAQAPPAAGHLARIAELARKGGKETALDRMLSSDDFAAADPAWVLSRYCAVVVRVGTSKPTVTATSDFIFSWLPITVLRRLSTKTPQPYTCGGSNAPSRQNGWWLALPGGTATIDGVAITQVSLPEVRLLEDNTYLVIGTVCPGQIINPLGGSIGVLQVNEGGRVGAVHKLRQPFISKIASLETLDALQTYLDTLK